ncbi:DUF4190 domain-containing protein [Homoserinibacter sp. GY 40078]|uniref:DUF4190 domain-containing protein n=1 Tax=Homoserinibacter sp. GY 40078 TaxID=2603275 RepID=UPI0011C7E082|nr:DUF4190 domain-containing protein [Homoserinibacter sp. GY 40078]TXK17084.1 DUF4190 domain-containing protein [Homoserinibacter sp. GY 40078]
MGIGELAEAADRPRTWSALAIIAVVAAVVAPPLGLVLGIVALVRVRRRRFRGRGLAIAAIVVAGVLCVAIALSAWAWASFTVEYSATSETVSRADG